MDKLNKYLHKIVKQYNGKVIYSQRSTYYHIGGRIIRVSDHIGKSSDGSISFIYDAGCSDRFIIHAKASGYVSIATYEDVKKVIKAFTILPALIGILETAPQAPKDEIVNQPTQIKVNKETKDYVLGYDKETFSENQLKTIQQMITSNKKKQKKKTKTMKLKGNINLT
jgi:hypothetical protein